MQSGSDNLRQRRCSACPATPELAAPNERRLAKLPPDVRERFPPPQYHFAVCENCWTLYAVSTLHNQRGRVVLGRVSRDDGRFYPRWQLAERATPPAGEPQSSGRAFQKKFRVPRDEAGTVIPLERPDSSVEAIHELGRGVRQMRTVLHGSGRVAVA